MDLSEANVGHGTVQIAYAQGHHEECRFRQGTPGHRVLLEHDPASPGV